jgi:hypothetical protein
VNCEALGEGLADRIALVAPATPDETLEAAAEVADATAEEMAAAALEALLEASAAAEEATDPAAEVALATAEEAAPAPGISMGTPASLHVFWTAAMVAALSEAEHAPSTQGCTEERRLAPFWQWHLKSVRAEQPSLERGVMKQLNYEKLVTVCKYRFEMNVRRKTGCCRAEQRQQKPEQ